MSENSNTQPVFTIEKIYVKDLSIEVPGAPQVFLEQANPQINVSLGNHMAKVDDSIYEVTINLSVSAKLPEDKTLFLVEIVQAGIFQIRDIPEAEIEPLTKIHCPNILFPYAREVVSDAVVRAGFQPLLLAPVNFEALYQAQKQQQNGNNNAN